MAFQVSTWPGVMFVVDSADPGRLEEAKRTLLEVVDHDHLKGVPCKLGATAGPLAKRLKNADL